MELITIIRLLATLFAVLLETHWLVERKKALEGKIECIKARMQDIREIFSSAVPEGQNQQQDFEFGFWMDKALELVEQAELLLCQEVGGWKNLVTSLKLGWHVDNLTADLEVHDKEGHILFRDVMSKARGSYCGNHIPVKPLVGRVASSILNQLEVLLQDSKVGRIVIHGAEGVGKSFFMKHLHNRARRCVGKFDHIFWVTIPDQCTIKHLQDVVAAVVRCDLGSNDNLNVRAKKLSDSLTGLDSFVLFLDGVSAANFSLDQAGIPVLAEESNCKLVLTARSTMQSGLSDSFEAFSIDFLPPDEAYKLFVQEARISTMNDHLLGDTPRLLADMCCGVPRTIVNVAIRMGGINDLCEWRNALYESGHLRMEHRLSFKVPIT